MFGELATLASFRQFVGEHRTATAHAAVSERTQGEAGARRLPRDLLVLGPVMPFFKLRFVVRSVS